MGTHARPPRFWAKLRADLARIPAKLAEYKPYVVWALSHRRKVASVLVVLLPFISRLVPQFPSADILAFVHMYFG